jgi:1-deoxy-D-xylulose-5-phosphate synthase
MIKGSHLEEAFQKFPERCFDVGINEEHALTMAGALSLNGFPSDCFGLFDLFAAGL